MGGVRGLALGGCVLLVVACGGDGGGSRGHEGGEPPDHPDASLAQQDAQVDPGEDATLTDASLPVDATVDEGEACDLTRTDTVLARYRRHVFERNLAIAEQALRCNAFAEPDALQAETERAERTACAFVLPALSAGRVRIDEQATETCLAGLRDADCAAVTPRACHATLVGAVSEGQPCYLAHEVQECAEGFYCDVSSACPGVCAPRTPIGGQPTSAPCVQNAYPLDGTCVAHALLGESCAPSAQGEPRRQCLGSLCNPDTLECQDSVRQGVGASCNGILSCNVGMACTAGKCALLGGVGDSCRITSDCLRELVCAPDTRTCREPGFADQVCQTELDCRAPLWCRDAPGPYGLCTAPLGEGSPCSDPRDCAAGLACALPDENGARTCRAPEPAGGPCTDRSHCEYPLYCISVQGQPGQCAERKPNGAACEESVECLSDVCSEGRCACYDTTAVQY